ncbi:hypothetical protein OVY01_19400 [Robbsia sp. Bb-Pol-6]|uniref:Uncharacterized protein n=1 Tax=Robbsia betulipollinis TaxID=2981849 RepID=A0ABT3ZRY5_9BURK|nr:hypothetical protein [Robbsia betulipollinis]MCY0389314.1 hypothetical protein [Robbsia betulipollinis]
MRVAIHPSSTFLSCPRSHNSLVPCRLAPAKQQVLLLSHAAIDTVALRRHANLQAVRMGHGGPDQIETLAAVLLLVGTLADAGNGDLAQDIDETAKTALTDAVRRGNLEARWEIDAAGLDALVAASSPSQRGCLTRLPSPCR